MRLPSICVVLASMVVSVPMSLTANPIGLNSEGCHNNRKTGDYHCRGGSSAARALRAPSVAASGSAQAFVNVNFLPPSEARAEIVPAGRTFQCTPGAVWDGDGPVWCAEGPKV